MHSECEANASALLLRRDSAVQPHELANFSRDDFIRCYDAVSTDDVSDTLLRYALCDSHFAPSFACNCDQTIDTLIAKMTSRTIPICLKYSMCPPSMARSMPAIRGHATRLLSTKSRPLAIMPACPYYRGDMIGAVLLFYMTVESRDGWLAARASVC